MIAESDKTAERFVCSADASPDEVDAAAKMAVKVRVSCPDGCDPTQMTVSIRDRDDFELASAGLARDGEDLVTDDIVLTAPRIVGEYAHRAVLLSEGEDGTAREEASAPFSFTVKAHAARMSVWGLPPTIVAGEPFRFTVGVKCTSGCKLAGRALNIVSHEGAEAGAASLRDNVWPDTEALYFAEIEAEAPAAAGDYTWEITTPASDTGIPHEAGALPLAIRVVNAPDCEVTVEAYDKEKKTPIKGAQVVMHPYRAQTDENGMAKIEVTKGEYNILVSGRSYIPVRREIEVTEDVTTRAELDPEPPELPPEDFY